MALTLKWWNELKGKPENKVNGKVAPETEFEKDLRIYDTARTALDKEKTAANYDKAAKALSDVETARKTSKASLEKQGFKKLADVLTPSVTSAESALLEKVKKEVEVASLQAKAANEAEAIYVTLWNAYEGQREKLNKQATKTLYASMVATLTKLEAQADKCQQSSSQLAPKYIVQAKLLAAERAKITNAQTAYNTALQNAIHARQQLLQSFHQLTPILQQSVHQLTNVKAQALTAQQARDVHTLGDTMKHAKAAATPVLAQYEKVNATFAPNSPVRTSEDIKAAKIALEDTDTLIRPHLDALIVTNKTNVAFKQSIDTLIREIEAIKII
jgi:hypothetical protein